MGTPKLHLRISVNCWGTQDHGEGLGCPATATLCPEGGCVGNQVPRQSQLCRHRENASFRGTELSPLVIRHQLLWPQRLGSCPSPLRVPGILCLQEEDASDIVSEWLQCSRNNARYFVHKSSPSVLTLDSAGWHDGAHFPGGAKGRPGEGASEGVGLLGERSSVSHCFPDVLLELRGPTF